MMPGFFIVFLPVLYWGMFLTSEKMKLLKWTTGFVSGKLILNLKGHLLTVSFLQSGLGEVVGLSWHWIIGLFILSMLLLMGKIFSSGV